MITSRWYEPDAASETGVWRFGWFWAGRSVTGYQTREVITYGDVGVDVAVGVSMVQQLRFNVGNKLNLREDATTGARLLGVAFDMKTRAVHGCADLATEAGAVSHVTTTNTADTTLTYAQFAASTESALSSSIVICPGAELCAAEPAVYSVTNITSTGFTLTTKPTAGDTPTWAVTPLNQTETPTTGRFGSDNTTRVDGVAGAKYRVQVTVTDPVTSGGASSNETAIWEITVQLPAEPPEPATIIDLSNHRTSSGTVITATIEGDLANATPTIEWGRRGETPTTYTDLPVYRLNNVYDTVGLIVVPGLPATPGEYVMSAFANPNETPTVEGYRI